MNILLVDDDNLVLQELREILEKQELGVEKIFIASCIDEARKLLADVPVQIMLCDIEMPGGTGLKLLEWVRQEGFSLECIFLTNYADFSYAQQAISLDSLEYLLKPIDAGMVWDTVQRAQKRVINKRQNEQARQYWLDNGKEAKDIFWQGCLLRGQPMKMETLRHLGYQSADRYLPAGLKAMSLSGLEKLWGADMFEYVLKNVLFELLDTPWFKAESVLPMPEGIWVALCRYMPDVAPDAGAVEERMEQVAEACEEKLHFQVLCGVGCVCGETELRKTTAELVDMMENTLGKKKGVVRLEEYHPQEYAWQMPDVSVWESLLKEKKQDQLTKDIRRYVGKRAQEGWTKQQMQEFRQDITQLFYSYLRTASIQAHKLFSGEAAERLYRRSLNSVEDMCLYCDFLAGQVIEYKKFTEEPSSVIEIILHYVDQHYCEEITRSDLANLVYISNDYCSRIFKKETGRTLAQYVLEKRVEKAKRLLESDLSVKNVALQTGYSNFSYFSKVFKEITGVTPMEYREKNWEKD